MSVTMVPGEDLAEVLNEGFREARELGIAAAYMTAGGLEKVEKSLNSVLDRSRPVQIVHGVDGLVTGPDVIVMLNEWSQRFPSLTYRVKLNGGLTKSPLFHPKLYWYERTGGNTTCVIGSSNLTNSGLTENTEINAVISGASATEPIRNCRHAFALLMDDSELFEPSDSFLQLYTRIHEQEQLQFERRRNSNELASLYEDLKDLVGYKPAGVHVSTNQVTQTGVVALALHSAGPGAELHVQDIYERARKIADELGLAYNWSTWKNSVRGRINENTTGKSAGKKLFVRVGDENSQSGVYRLSDSGKELVSQVLIGISTQPDSWRAARVSGA